MPWNIFPASREESDDSDAEPDEQADPEDVAADGNPPADDGDSTEGYLEDYYDYDDDDEEYIVSWQSSNGAIEAHTRSKSPLFGILFVAGGIAIYLLGMAALVVGVTLLTALVVERIRSHYTMEKTPNAEPADDYYDDRDDDDPDESDTERGFDSVIDDEQDD